MQTSDKTAKVEQYEQSQDEQKAQNKNVTRTHTTTEIKQDIKISQKI